MKTVLRFDNRSGTRTRRLRKSKMRIDLFTFLQKLPETSPTRSGLAGDHRSDAPISARPVDSAGRPRSKELFQDGMLAPDSGDAIWSSWADLADLMSETDELGGLQFLEMRSTLPDELLMYADKLSMAHSLELRVPFIDKEIVEYVETLPANLKVRNGSRKWLHRQVCRTYLPESLLKRRKRGFAGNVVDDWFRDAIDNKMVDTLRDPNREFIRTCAPRQSATFLIYSIGDRTTTRSCLA